MENALKYQLQRLSSKLKDLEFGNFGWFNLLELAANLMRVSGFEQLLSIHDFNIRLFPHQESAVLKALKDMHGRALLCDDVGLGKTIIALAILKELQIRALVKSILIMVPSSLVMQWHSEMNEKFNMYMPIITSGRDLKAFLDPNTKPHAKKSRMRKKLRIITNASISDNACSIFDLRSIESNITTPQDPATKEKNYRMIVSSNLAVKYQDLLLKHEWDIVIVDEAHRINNRRSKSWAFVNNLKKKYILLITATPMENNLEDIFSLATLVSPIFGSYRQFRKQFGVPKNPRACKDPIGLRRQLDNVMIRRRRNEIEGVFFPERKATTLQFNMQPEELHVYDDVTKYVTTSYRELESLEHQHEKITRDNKKKLEKIYNIDSKRFFKRKIWLHKLTLITLQRRICSSHHAACKTLDRMIAVRQEKKFDQERIELLKKLNEKISKLRERQSSKLNVLLKLLERVPEKCVIFTEFKDSL
ncbi:MAG: DEAD/DEAH box helicase, partial [Promethearchaeota archaeon]